MIDNFFSLKVHTRIYDRILINQLILSRTVGRSKNPRVLGGGGARKTVVGIIYPLVEVGLNVQPKTVGG